jgi:hypothetical protein
MSIEKIEICNSSNDQAAACEDAYYRAEGMCYDGAKGKYTHTVDRVILKDVVITRVNGGIYFTFRFDAHFDACVRHD